MWMCAILVSRSPVSMAYASAGEELRFVATLVFSVPRWASSGWGWGVVEEVWVLLMGSLYHRVEYPVVHVSNSA